MANNPRRGLLRQRPRDGCAVGREARGFSDQGEELEGQIEVLHQAQMLLDPLAGNAIALADSHGTHSVA